MRGTIYFVVCLALPCGAWILSDKLTQAFGFEFLFFPVLMLTALFYSLRLVLHLEKTTSARG